MRYRYALIALLFAAAVAKAEGPVRVGICNVGKVLDGLDERKTIEAAMKSRGVEHNAEVARRRKAIEDLSAQREELKPESELYQKKTEELIAAATQLDVMNKIREAEFSRLEKQHTARLYDQIRAACKSAAAAHNLDLVVAERPVDSTRDLNRLTIDQLRMLLSTSEVLYASNQFDLTEEIILAINKQFATAKPGKP